MTDRISSKRTSGSGQLSAGDTFAQTDWRSWSSTQYDDQGRTTSTRVYHDIPSSGTGVVGTSYGQTNYGYDALERRNRVKAPGGTITRTVWTAPQRVASEWVGTDDTGATDANPAGSGSPNNMVKVTENQYDGGSDQADGTLTQVTQYASATDTRVTAYGYDWRDRRTSQDGEVDLYEQYTYDNLDRLTQTDRRDTTSGGNLIGRTQIKYDDRGRVYQTVTYAVDPSTGTVGNALTGNTWYDAGQNVIKQIDPGAGQVFTKSTYNGVGWPTATYRGYDTSESGYSAATTLTSDTILEQVENTYDEAGNLVSQATYARLNDATGTGALLAGTQPKARVSYAASWYDGADRPIASANYGAAASFSRPSTAPASSDTVLVTTTEYDDAGRAWKTVDPRGIERHTAFDDAGRTTQTVEAYSASTADDLNRTTNFTYTPDNLVATMTAVNGRTGDQTTTYTYGTTLSDSDVARSDLLRYTTYPDSVANSDRTANTYNRQGQRKTFTDQRGTVRTFEYDKLGRLLHDRVTTVGGGTDNAVLRVSTAYEVRGLVQTVTSYDNATVGSGSVLDQVKLEYNSFGQLTKESQDHAAAVGGSSPNVQYAYASGASGSNQVRPTGLTYPNAAVDHLRLRHQRRGRRRAEPPDGDQGREHQPGGLHVPGARDRGPDRLGRAAGAAGPVGGHQRHVRRAGPVQPGGRPAVAVLRGHARRPGPLQVRLRPGLEPHLEAERGWQRAGRVLYLRPLEPAGHHAARHPDRHPPDRHLRHPRRRAGLDAGPDRQLARVPDQVRRHDGPGPEPHHSTVNAITAITEATGPSWVDPAYDAAGNTTTLPQPDPTLSFTATYDAWDRLREVKDGSNTVARYRYDGRNRRIVKETYTGGTLSETRHVYSSDAWQAARGAGGRRAPRPTGSTSGAHRYVDELVCRDRAVTGGGTERLYALQDANFNVTALADTSGTVKQRLVYEPYGNAQVVDASWSGTPDSYEWVFRHQSGRLSVFIALYAFRNRDYQPSLGTWVQRDPKGHVDGLTLYGYLAENPVTHRDPAGTLPHPATRCFLMGHCDLEIERAGRSSVAIIGGSGPGILPGAGDAISSGQLFNSRKLPPSRIEPKEYTPNSGLSSCAEGPWSQVPDAKCDCLLSIDNSPSL